MTMDLQIRNFFNQYASRMNNALFNDPIDIDGIVQSFAEQFVGASSVGIQPGQNDDRFKSAIRERILFYRSIGVRSMVILEQDVHALDELHALAKIQWNCVFEGLATAGEIEFTNYYLVWVRNTDVIKIFAYVTGDETKAFREHGLL